MAKDRIKDSLGYADAKKGLSGMLEYTHEFAADFGLSLFKVEENLLKNQKTIDRKSTRLNSSHAT